MNINEYIRIVVCVYVCPKHLPAMCACLPPFPRICWLVTHGHAHTVLKTLVYACWLQPTNSVMLVETQKK